MFLLFSFKVIVQKYTKIAEYTNIKLKKTKRKIIAKRCNRKSTQFSAIPQQIFCAFTKKNFPESEKEKILACERMILRKLYKI